MPLCCCRRRRTNRVDGGHRVKTRTLSDGAEVLETIYFDAETLRSNETHQEQLSKIVSPELDTFFSPTKPYWGAAATVDDCFDAKIVDDGVVSVTEFSHVDEQGVTVPYYYWCARFGGNAAGHVIRGCAAPSTEHLPTGDPEGGLPVALGGPGEPWVVRSLLGGPWVAVAQNVDDDLTWTCPSNPAPEGFMERLRAVVAKE